MEAQDVFGGKRAVSRTDMERMATQLELFTDNSGISVDIYGVLNDVFGVI